MRAITIRTGAFMVLLAAAALQTRAVASIQDAGPSSPSGMDTATALMEENAYGEAAKVFARVVQAEPDNARAWFLMGYSLHADGQLEKAIEVHEKASTFDEYHGIALYNLGCAHALRGDHDAALVALNRSGEAGFDLGGHMMDDPDLRSLHEDSRFHMLSARHQPQGGGGLLGKLRTGFEQVKGVIATRGPEVIEQIKVLARQAMALIQQKIAEFQGERGGGGPGGPWAMEQPGEVPHVAIEAVPHDEPHEHDAAEIADSFGTIPTADEIRALMDRRDWNAAAAACRRVVQVAPDNGQAWFYLGFTLHSAGKLDEAMEAHRKAATFDEFEGIALYNLGCAHSLQGDTAKAFEALERSRKAGGFDLLGAIEGDSDLDNIRGDKRYRELLDVLRHPDL